MPQESIFPHHKNLPHHSNSHNVQWWPYTFYIYYSVKNHYLFSSIRFQEIQGRGWQNIYRKLTWAKNQRKLPYALWLRWINWDDCRIYRILRLKKIQKKICHFLYKEKWQILLTLPIFKEKIFLKKKIKSYQLNQHQQKNQQHHYNQRITTTITTTCNIICTNITFIQ